MSIKNDRRNPSALTRKLGTSWNALSEGMRARYAPQGTPWVPPTDVAELADCFIIRMEAPGLDAGQISLLQDGMSLVVEGHRSAPALATEASFLSIEIQYGPFERVIEFDEPFDLTGARASYSGGILSFEIRKATRTPRTAQFVRIRIQETT
jgi:HSP20 family molecular chaperone IbpA